MQRHATRDLLWIIPAALILLAPTTSIAAAKRQPPSPGFVVEDVGQGSAGEAAGIQPGDVLLEWSRAANPPANPAPAHGAFGSPFDVREVEIEQADRGTVALTVRRGDRRLSLAMPRGSTTWESWLWRIAVRPDFAGERLVAFQQARDLEQAGDLDEAEIAWRDLASRCSRSGDHALAAWLYGRAGTRTHGEAVREAETAGLWRLVAQLWENAAEDQGSDPDRRTEAYGRALELRERYEPASLATAQTLSSFGWLQEDGPRTELFLKALRIREAQAPGSLGVGKTLRYLGSFALMRGDLDEAEALSLRSFEILERLAPDSLLVADNLKDLSALAFRRGDLRAAEQIIRKALAIQERLEPRSERVAETLSNLGSVLLSLDDGLGAYDCLARALALEKALNVSGSIMARTLTVLGWISIQLDDLDRAEAFLTQALEVLEKGGPEDPGNPAEILLHLAYVARLRNRLDLAESLVRKAVPICEQLPKSGFARRPNGYDLTVSDLPTSVCLEEALWTLGGILKDKGEFQAAFEVIARLSAIHHQQAPGSVRAADHLIDDLIEGAELLASQGQYRIAEGALARAQALIVKELEDARHHDGESSMWRDYLTPLGRPPQLSTLEWAALNHGIRSLQVQASLLWRQGRFAEAERAFRNGVELLERRRALTRGSPGRNLYDPLYFETLIDLASVSQAGPDSDFLAILERLKAGALLDMLAARDLDLSADLPLDVQAERSQVDRDYERIQSLLSSPSSQRDADRLLIEFQELGGRRDQLNAQIRMTSPKYSSLKYPQPLDLDGVATSLDRGTLMLSYAIGKERSLLLFATSDCTAGVIPLALGETELREAVEAFRTLIDWKTRPGEGPPATLVARGRLLYDALIRPAEPWIAVSDRLLIIPDGPLHSLPWAALIRGVKAGRPQYLVEWKPLHTAISATVYAELKKRPRSAPSSSPILVAAFGDPAYPRLSPAEEDEELADPQVRLAVHRGARLEPLPATRREVESIAKLYSPGTVKYLGEDATEEQAKSLGKDVPLIHFACHAYVNERFPLDSALVLTIPEKPGEGQENGLLQAWEIFEKVHIDADLVTLSACETGLGKEIGGEGLIGLTRAFQYAGARSVLSSLWKVDDRSTEELMTRFYGHLRGGKPKDEALRQAQIDLIRSRDLSLPSRWAAFQINGDWR
jgi:CHAT domain-containing protein